MVTAAMLLVGRVWVLGWQGATTAEGVRMQGVEGVLGLVLSVTG